MYTSNDEIARRQRLLESLRQGSQQPGASTWVGGLGRMLQGWESGKLGKQNQESIEKNAQIRQDEMNQLIQAMGGGINAPMMPGQTRDLQHPDAQALKIQMDLQRQQQEGGSAACSGIPC